MVDQILEYEVVTTDGKFQRVSECSNPELFWATRGGGGGTFGIVTAATIMVYPTIPVVVSRFFVNSTTPKLWDAVAYFLQQGPSLREKYGAQGYFYVYHNAFQSVLHFPGRYATEANAKAAFEPLLAKMNELASATPQPAKYYSYKTFKDWFVAENGNHEMMDKKIKFLSWYDGSDGSAPGQSQAMENPLSVLPWITKNPQNPSKRSLDFTESFKTSATIGLAKRQNSLETKRPMARTYLDSRLLSEKHINSVSQSELARIMNKTLPGITNNHIRGFLYGGGKMAEPNATAMSVNPARRTMSYHLIVNAVPGDIRHDYDVSELKRAFPDAGAYVNEASPGEPNWKKVYWGSNYARLEQIKKKYDPQNVLWCSPCVGGDYFTYDDERICKNPAYPTKDGVPPPQTYVNMSSKTGIASLPGVPGIANALRPWIEAFIKNGTVPSELPDFSKLTHSEAAPKMAADGPIAHVHEGFQSRRQVSAEAGSADLSASPSPSAAPEPAGDGHAHGHGDPKIRQEVPSTAPTPAGDGYAHGHSGPRKAR